MLNGIDISSWQADLDVGAMKTCDFVIAKATEGVSYVNPCCDRHVQQAIAAGKLWGFYHFANMGDPAAEADYFVGNTANYFKRGIPVLDWEQQQDVGWVNRFVRRVREKTGIWPWIYGNPWRFDQGGVEPNCARWVAAYPPVTRPGFDYAGECPSADGNVVCWQYASDGRVPGYGGNLDVNHYYGDRDSWLRYAGAENAPAAPKPEQEPAPEGPSGCSGKTHVVHKGDTVVFAD